MRSFLFRSPLRSLGVALALLGALISPARAEYQPGLLELLAYKIWHAAHTTNHTLTLSVGAVTQKDDFNLVDSNEVNSFVHVGSMLAHLEIGDLALQYDLHPQSGKTSFRLGLGPKGSGFCRREGLLDQCQIKPVDGAMLWQANPSLKVGDTVEIEIPAPLAPPAKIQLHLD